MKWSTSATWAVIGALASGFFIGGAAGADQTLFGATVAAWIQAVGSITAIVVAGVTVSLQLRAARQAEVKARNAALADQQFKLESVWEVAQALMINATAQLEPLIAHAERPRELTRWRDNVAATVGPIVWAQERLSTFPAFELGNAKALLAFVDVRTNLHFAELAIRDLDDGVLVNEALAAKSIKGFLIQKKVDCVKALTSLEDEWRQVADRFDASLERAE